MAFQSKGLAKQPLSERTVEVQIENNSKDKILTEAAPQDRSLRNSTSHILPMTYNYSGHVYNPAPPIISPGGKGDATFVKTKGAARGSVGILTYRFGDNQFSLMFSNPYDYNLYSIVFALYIPDRPVITDKSLYKKMYSQLTPKINFAKEVLSPRSETISVSGGGLIVSATMSNEAHSIIKVDVRDA
ncbi:DELTA-actitoxin-Aeq1a-like isoform X1 [Heptranchias perlo]|uniref:DELTA-actitoxin-Aeq1a-like isoform X1 n=1 Tax=Heptranchias perlo TaxID=212740 RepID=UPI003559BF52